MGTSMDPNKQATDILFTQEKYTVEPLIAATFTAKVRWPLLGGGRYWEVAAIQRFTTNMGKRLGLKVSGRYREMAAVRRWQHLRGSTVVNFNQR